MFLFMFCAPGGEGALEFFFWNVANMAKNPWLQVERSIIQAQKHLFYDTFYLFYDFTHIAFYKVGQLGLILQSRNI